MASYFRERGTLVYRKQCSCCNEVTRGTTDLQESIVIFSSMFAESNGSAGMADGFQSRCWVCNASKRRSLGIDRPKLEAMMRAQDSKCAICTRELSIARNALNVNKANVDHDEESGEVRGLLCGNCNRGIGMFFHEPTALKQAALYCEHYTKIIQLKRGSHG